MEIKAVLIDDEEAAIENLSQILEDYCPEVQILATETSIAAGIKTIIKHQPDLVFLDISMPPEGEGFDLLEAFPKRNFLIIFVTAHEDHSLKAIKRQAFDYILKPIDFREVRQSVENVRVALMKSATETARVPKTIKLSTMEGLHIIRPEQVLYCKANGSYTQVSLVDGSSILVSKTLKSLEDALPGNIFFRVHRSYVINGTRVTRISKKDGGFVELEDETQIPMSENYREEILAFLS